MTVWTSLESPKTTLMAASFAVVFRLDLCNAPTGVKGQTLAKGVRLLGKSTGSYGKLEIKGSLVLNWTSELGRCLTRQSKRSCSEAVTEKAISDKPSTKLRTRGSTKEQRVEMNRDERGFSKKGL